MLKQIQKLYDQGKTAEALELIAQSMPPEGDPQRGDYLALKGWCCYRRKEYAEAQEAAMAAGSVRSARELLAYLAAYAPGYVDDGKLQQMADELGDSVAVVNALVIRARAPESTLFTPEEVLRRVLQHRGDEVVVANLYNNAARFFQEKARGDTDLITALGLFDCALVKYGHAVNFHHRAALQYWRSYVLEKLFGNKAAIVAATRALELWVQQLALDPDNKSFQEKQEQARRRLADLSCGGTHGAGIG